MSQNSENNFKNSLGTRLHDINLNNMLQQSDARANNKFSNDIVGLLKIFFSYKLQAVVAKWMGYHI